jgi:hypothetical protein
MFEIKWIVYSPEDYLDLADRIYFHRIRTFDGSDVCLQEKKKISR